jgi:hypothetical protein
MTRYADLFGACDWPWPSTSPPIDADAQAYAAVVVGREEVRGAPWFAEALRLLVASAFQAGIFHERSRALQARGKESS